MITPAYVQTMTRYNSEMNRRVFAAAGRLPDAERRTDRGAFWRSIHGTLNHLLWADRIWMSRFAPGWEKPPVPIRQSGELIDAFDDLARERAATDAALEAWAEGVTAEELAGDLHWHSGALGRDVASRRDILVMHFFNHQTHHRGQVHALLTRAGETTGDTDLWIVMPGLDAGPKAGAP